MLLGTQQIGENGHLYIGGCDTVELANRFGTPLYVMDESALRTTMRAYRAAFEDAYPSTEFYFASKSFLCIAMAVIVEQEGYHMDVASLGELFTALEAGFPPERLALHGNNKSVDELEAAVAAGIGHVIVDNFYELNMLKSIMQGRPVTMKIMIRATPGVDPQTHRLIRTGQADTKFGFNIKDGSALKAVKESLASDSLQFIGVHCHVGSQLLESDTHVQAAQVMAQLLLDIRKETGVIVENLNIGGGLGVRYSETDVPPAYHEFAAAVVQPLKEALEKEGVPLPTLQQEPGRSITGEAGTTLYQVGAVKRVPIDEEGGTRLYASIDGGLSDNPRPQLYQANYSCLLANRAQQPADTHVRVAGKHCETDILIQDTLLPEPASGDILAVQTTGAYNFAMASNYNRFLRPAVVLVNDGEADVIVERQTLADLLRGEHIPSRLLHIPVER